MGAPRFPIGGPREPVYAFLRERDWIMSDWSDKHWTRHDGRTLHLYGSGSRAIVRDASGATLADDALDIAVRV